MNTEINPQSPNPAASAPVLPLVGLIQTVLRRWKLVSIVTGLTLSVSLLLLSLTPPAYDARMVVAPAGNGAANMATSKLGGLASVASAMGANLSPLEGRSDEFEKFRLLLTSSIVAASVERDHRKPVLSMMFDGEWNAASGRWVRPSGPISLVKQGLDILFGLPSWAPPNAETLAAKLKKNVHINRVPESDLIELTFASRDPDFARNLLGWLYVEADRRLRKTALAQSRQELNYVNRKLQTVTVQEDRAALTQLVFQLEQKIMLTQSNQPYAAMVVDGPTVPNLPDSPKPVWFIVFGILFGIMLGSITAVVVDLMEPLWRSRSIHSIDNLI